MASPRAGSGVQTAVSFTTPAAQPSSGGGGTDLPTLQPKPPAPPPPGAKLVFPAWLKWALIGGAVYLLWPKKKSASLGSMLAPQKREPKLREFHINEETEDDAEYEEDD